MAAANQALLRSERIVTGGLFVNGRRMLRWRWSACGGVHCSRDFRCSAEQWYVVRGVVKTESSETDAFAASPSDLVVRFFSGGREIARRPVALERLPRLDNRHERIGWFQAPMHAESMNVEVAASIAETFDWIAFRRVVDRRACSHPIASIPSWTAYAPSMAIRSVLLPQRLAGLETFLPADMVGELPTPAALAEIEDAITGAAWILDPKWIPRLKLDWKSLVRLAARSRVLIDLDTASRLLGDAHLLRVEADERTYTHDIPGARVEYADAETRGFALMDVFPWAAVDERGRFVTRVLNGGKCWDAPARRLGFNTLLTSDAVAGGRGTQVIAAAMDVGGPERGESRAAIRIEYDDQEVVDCCGNGDTRMSRRSGQLAKHPTSGSSGRSIVISDAPWLLAGRWGMPVAAELVAHVLRMQLGLPFESHGQYLAPTDQPELLIRDVADFARRYPPMRPVRWTNGDGGTLRLGITYPIPPETNGVLRAASGLHVLIRTGRCDGEGGLGFPAEVMMVLMRTLWRDEKLRRTLLPRAGRVTWQFESASGRRYASCYDAAIDVAPPDRVLDWGERCGPIRPVGFLGERSIALTSAALDALRDAPER